MEDLRFKTLDELINALGANNGIYCKLEKLKDQEIGFVVERWYPPEIAEKNSLLKCCNIKIAYLKNPNEYLDQNLVYLKAEIGVKFGNNFIESIQTQLSHKPKIGEPIDLKIDGYRFDHRFNSIGNGNGKSIKPEDFLDFLFQLHIQPCKPIKGLIFRQSARFYRFVAVFIDFLVGFNKGLMRHLSGRKLEKKFSSPDEHLMWEFQINKYDIFKKNEIESIDTEKISAFGLTANRKVIVTSAITILVGVLLYNYTKFGNWKIKGHTLVITSGSILIMFFWDQVFPILTLSIHNVLMKVKLKIFFKKS